MLKEVEKVKERYIDKREKKKEAKLKKSEIKKRLINIA